MRPQPRDHRTTRVVRLNAAVDSRRRQQASTAGVDSRRRQPQSWTKRRRPRISLQETDGPRLCNAAGLGRALQPWHVERSIDSVSAPKCPMAQTLASASQSEASAKRAGGHGRTCCRCVKRQGPALCVSAAPFRLEPTRTTRDAPSRVGKRCAPRLAPWPEPTQRRSYAHHRARPLRTMCCEPVLAQPMLMVLLPVLPKAEQASQKKKRKKGGKKKKKKSARPLAEALWLASPAIGQGNNKHNNRPPAAALD
ncbi:hypothetical protein CDD82_3367 [Ophiocordyceps australis]|uniref:Uncharacterized protein n=1 Tax=Ophiocordyceps australis TaxID=1399860 RepID=A0A2C5ZCN7_9HYPO|nr:hypothetical protein CDD82_3367 [Ophiocordyceps australis]